MRVLIIKTSALGDILHALPLADYLQQHPDVQEIDWVSERPGSEILEHCPWINSVHLYDSKAWRKRPFAASSRQSFSSFRQRLQQKTYDYVFDLQGNTKSALPGLLSHAHKKVGYGWKSVPEWPNLLSTQLRLNPPSGLSVRARYLYFVQSCLPLPTYQARPLQLQLSPEASGHVDKIAALDSPFWLLCPGSAWKNKQLPQAQVLSLSRALLEHSPVQLKIAWGSPEEERLADELTAALGPRAQKLPKLPLSQLHAVIQRARGVIAMDSLALHLASSCQAPTFGFFGPSSSQHYAPAGLGNASYQGACPYGLQFTQRCPKLRRCATGACLREQPTEDLCRRLLDWAAQQDG
jgi:heptosyltransferase-1